MLTKENLYMKEIKVFVPLRELEVTLSNGLEQWTFNFKDNESIKSIEMKLPNSWPLWTAVSVLLVIEAWLDKDINTPGFFYDDPEKTLIKLHKNKLLFLGKEIKPGLYFEHYKDWIPNKSILN